METAPRLRNPFSVCLALVPALPLPILPAYPHAQALRLLNLFYASARLHTPHHKNTKRKENKGIKRKEKNQKPARKNNTVRASDVFYDDKIKNINIIKIITSKYLLKTAKKRGLNLRYKRLGIPTLPAHNENLSNSEFRAFPLAIRRVCAEKSETLLFAPKPTENRENNIIKS